MKVTVDPEALAFIQAKGGHLILFQAQATGCCSTAPLGEDRAPSGLN
jgi:hypothetical protein